MNRITLLALFLITWLAVFAQSQFGPVRSLLGVPIALVPALMTYVALTHSLVVTSVFALVAGAWLDALSATRLGITILPLLAFGVVLHLRRHLLLRDQRYAQFWLGLTGGAGVNLGVFTLLSLGDREPISGWVTVWQWILLGLLNGACCPAVFALFDAVHRTFDYQPVTETSFRSDREIKRGRFDTFR
jgi:cell shape-determining protein MreD